MKVLLVGEIYSSNLGDGVIFEVVYKKIISVISAENIFCFDLSLRKAFEINKERDFDVHLYKKLYIKKHYFRHYYEKELMAILRKRYECFEKELSHMIISNKITHLILIGGALFKDFFVDRLKIIEKVCKQYNLKIIINACGFGTISCKKNRIAINEFINSRNVIYKSFRDTCKYKDIHLYNYLETFDSVISISHSNFNIGEKIGLGVMYVSNYSYKRQCTFWVLLINKLIEKKLDFDVFCNGSQEDYAFIRHIFKIGNFSNYHLKERPKTPSNLVEIISNYKTIVSMRLHSIIIAYSLGIRTIAISWDDKIDCFFRKIRETKYLHSFLNSSDQIVNSLELISKDDSFFEMREFANEMVNKNYVELFEAIKRR